MKEKWKRRAFIEIQKSKVLYISGSIIFGVIFLKPAVVLLLSIVVSLTCAVGMLWSKLQVAGHRLQVFKNEQTFKNQMLEFRNHRLYADVLHL